MKRRLFLAQAGAASIGILIPELADAYVNTATSNERRIALDTMQGLSVKLPSTMHLDCVSP